MKPDATKMGNMGQPGLVWAAEFLQMGGLRIGDPQIPLMVIFPKKMAMKWG